MASLKNRLHAVSSPTRCNPYSHSPPPPQASLESLSSLLEREEAWLRRFVKYAFAPSDTLRARVRDLTREYEGWAGTVRNLTTTVKRYFKELTDMLGEGRSFSRSHRAVHVELIV